MEKWRCHVIFSWLFGQVYSVSGKCSGAGCDRCSQTGRQGRMAVTELLEVDPALAEAITAGIRGVALRSLMAEQGFIDIRENAETLMRSGEISKHEAERALGLE